MAKALATEAGANFISITGSTLTSKVGRSMVFVGSIQLFQAYHLMLFLPQKDSSLINTLVFTDSWI